MLDHEQRYCFTYEGLESLSGLRFLEVEGSMRNFDAEERLRWHESPSNVLPTNENSVLLPRLRWLSWRCFPPTLNIANFFVEDLVILNLSWSKITDDWKGWSHMKVMKNLKVLNLSYCDSLQRLPDEPGRGLASLEYVSLSFCSSLKRLPDSIGNMKSPIELDISYSGIGELPDSIRKLKNLKRLKMQGSKISKIPDTLWMIEKLEEIDASNISPKFHVNIGNCIHKNESLRILKLFSAEIHLLARLPESLVTLSLGSLEMDTFPDLSNLTNLKELDLRFSFLDSDGESYGETDVLWKNIRYHSGLGT
ncbi:disease resistance protein RUN1-like [Rhodamnia argentea]|uniref:Disease resistance protein RUN1-like n=1 Tax=Rhodamnia argentea TaxID=178133 RepID=A0ABM3GZ17_9MYRT|nr:disease resistance protein RUN1-like [Rhodamnia argentea]